MSEPKDLRMPPQAIGAEQALIGAVLMDNGVYDALADLVSVSDFYRHEHQLLWSAIHGLLKDGRPADLITVFEFLRSTGQDAAVGGLPYINDLLNCVPSGANAVAHAQVVRNRSLLRQTIAASDEVSTEAFKADSPGPVVERGLESFTRISIGMDAKRKPKRLSEIMLACMDAVQGRADGEIEPGWPLGLPTLDQALNGGLRPGRVYVLAARPSVGKSSLAQRCGLRMAANGLPTLFLSQEMDNEECGLRALACTGRINYGGLQTGKLAGDDWARLAVAGTLKAGAWVDRDGAARPNLDMVVAQVLTAYHLQRRRKAMQPSTDACTAQAAAACPGRRGRASRGLEPAPASDRSPDAVAAYEAMQASEPHERPRITPGCSARSRHGAGSTDERTP